MTRAIRLGAAAVAVAIVGLTVRPLPATGASTPALSCLGDQPGVTWMPWTASQRTTLDAWCASTGPPVFHRSRVRPGFVDRLLIVSWNIHVGGGRVEDLLPRLWNDARDSGHTGVVLLLEETFRAGSDVPASYPGGLRVPSAIRPRRPALDVVGLAQRFGLSVAYVPSMRNGPSTSASEREDRGNAVLSTEPLSDVRAIELPFGRQRRVAVVATVTPRGGVAPPVRVVTAHFDIGRHRVSQAEALGARIAEVVALPTVVGGDLNSLNGFRDGALHALSRRVPVESCGTGRTIRWPLRLDVLAFFVGRLDFMFSTLGASGIARECETLADPYGSDHLPLLLTVRF